MKAAMQSSGVESLEINCKGNVSSPTSVVAAQGMNVDLIMETIVLGYKQQEEKGFDEEAWICPASAKSIRTINPIRAIVDPIVQNIQTGEQRGDGKDLISLAVSTLSIMAVTL